MNSLTELKDFHLCKNWRSYPGYHIPNPDNCKTYYQCQANGAVKGGYEAILRDCGAGTGFDPSLGNCNFLSSLPRCVRGMYYLICLYVHYGNTGCGIFKWGIQNWKDFCLKINIPQGNY